MERKCFFFKRLAEVPGREFTEELFFQTLLFFTHSVDFCSALQSHACVSLPTHVSVYHSLGFLACQISRSEQLYKTVSAVVLAPGLTLASS